MSESTIENVKSFIEPVTRVEGHGKVTILLDENNQRRRRPASTSWSFVASSASSRAALLGAARPGAAPVRHLPGEPPPLRRQGRRRHYRRRALTPTGEKMRRLMHYGQMFQSHALHFFHLASPDLLFGFDAPVEQRNVVAVIAEHPDLAVQGVMMRKYGQEIIKATAGKKVHGTGAIPGGINKNLSIDERDALLADIEPDARVEPQGGRDRQGLQPSRTWRRVKEFGSFDSNHLSIVRDDGAMDLYHGNLRAIDAEGTTIIDQVSPLDYLDVIAEEVRPWSYMKFPFLKPLGPEERLVPGRAAGAPQHLRLHRHSRGRGGAAGVPRAHRRRCRAT